MAKNKTKNTYVEKEIITLQKAKSLDTACECSCEPGIQATPILFATQVSLMPGFWTTCRQQSTLIQ